MQKIIFFGLLVSLNICGGSLFASQATKVHVHSDAVHDMAVFEMLEKIKAKVSSEIIEGLLKKNKPLVSFSQKLNKDIILDASTFSKHGTIRWKMYHNAHRTVQGFVLGAADMYDLCDEKWYQGCHSIITPWGSYVPVIEFCRCDWESSAADIRLNEKLHVKRIGTREQKIDGIMVEYDQYAIQSIDDIELPQVVWHNDACKNAWESLQNIVITD